VYAEDADAGFLPQAGRAEVVRWPERARVDAALESGQDVGTSYDPMLAKLIVTGPTREAARRSMIDALDDSAIVGLTTNLGFLRRLVASEAYRDAAIDTAWLDRSPDALPHEMPDLALVAAGWVLAGAGAAAPSSADPFGAGDGWRLGGPPAPVVLELEHRGEPILLQVDRAAGQVSEGERSWRVHQVAREGDRLRLDVDGVLSEVTAVSSAAGGVTLVVHGETMIFAPRDTTATPPQAISDGTISAPMPGTVRDVSATVGAKVQAGDVLGVMEAMKMELSLRAPFDGVVTEVDAVVGEQVPLGRRLFTVTADEES
jgi:acetyl-CoA/propionyl-CoA carboxylase, biotin carboxylase, biotin carboxyl carrier protein